MFSHYLSEEDCMITVMVAFQYGSWYVGVELG